MPGNMMVEQRKKILLYWRQKEMQSQVKLNEEELQKLKRKQCKFDNVFLDAIYNIIAYIPAAIITWCISQLE